MNRRKTSFRLLVAFLCLLCLLTLMNFRVPALVYLWLLQPGPGARNLPGGIELSAYCADIEARPVLGIERNLSGLTYNAETGTLFAVINRPASIAELTLEGQLLRVEALEGLGDPEGITHVKGQWFIVADEEHNRMHMVELPTAGSRAVVSPPISPPFDLSSISKLGIEGISWDQSRGKLIVVQEKWPQRVLELSGLTEPSMDASPGTRFSVWQLRGWFARVTADQSSVTVDAVTGSKLILSASSALVAEYDKSGELLEIMPLLSGRHGLSGKIPQAEESPWMATPGCMWCQSRICFTVSAAVMPVAGDMLRSRSNPPLLF